MGKMKELLITVYGGGDEAVAAVRRIGDDWRAQLEQAAAEIERLRLTDAEREAVEAILADPDLVLGNAREALRGLLERLSGSAAMSDAGQSAETGHAPEPAIPPEWTSRPYWVDPASGHRYGFPKLYDPASDGDMTEWMIANGYPERLARQKLPCTFTACTEDGGM